MATTKVAGVNVSTDHFIDGKRVESKRKFANCSPIDGKHLADMSAGGAEEIDAAVAAARRAYPKWAALGPEGRHPILKRFAQAILDHGKEIAAVETEDNGSLLIGNTARVVPRAALNISFFADRALHLNDEKIDSPEVVNHVRFDPAGRRRAHHALERPLHAHHLEGRSVPRRRRHRGGETSRVGAADLLTDG